ncbi:MAG: hypothetical protein A2921_04465 [Candidatus Magasanikbacteria bacterium RIFCSPLOWO2_01_FULL_43_20b]|uniref:Acylneuraminate cytidylyltransferase n=1 Tax=Candidatus Magasanikbacteria bacterium RIFCSPLOWO2_12_FULL_43_12 TaxID=1798692 RepID=A0A1F6MRN4_9BACT|nr:MAG: hypothetical protein A3C74_02690 [Candidatus Magasanikbacteria bacterium RIFCSPHIGHO2_02_FULL_44_13]OGH72583.1 MAG: hypothetical protein A3I93_01475 [Candidatus Magasanikbacteria bacterium RIFCSPLOWO2_02_FULL_43_22]OGH73322.1 MAG: hypothetical protein A2921_04465 [Candidatus Magasanikbacteria bacterium RIFCSPLOWO2_01_FULL_43_20b]OGH74329.1 MAG: hypothetical protein A3G00_02655 [Candidatus Magasanikbacteria bacterium RIFCSPLOWO2_12_FULL_43_12]
MKIVAIIQARMGASRLPGKVLLDIGGKKAIELVWERVSQSRKVAEIWLATTTSPGDDELYHFIAGKRIKCYRGSEFDVLDRYYQTALLAAAGAVVRITGDCPFIDPSVIDEVIAAFLEGNYDYVSNTHPPTFPDGLDVEVFSFAALKKTWAEAILKSEREHVTSHIWNHPEKFKLKNVESKKNYSRERWTLDTKDDLEFIRRVVGEFQKHGKGFLSWLDILDIVSQHPEWTSLNSHQRRNEGYFKSLAED